MAFLDIFKKAGQSIGNIAGNIAVFPIRKAEEKILSFIPEQQQQIAEKKLQDIETARKIRAEQPSLALEQSRQIAQQKRQTQEMIDLALQTEMTGGTKVVPKIAGFEKLGDILKKNPQKMKTILNHPQIPETEKINLEKKPLINVQRIAVPSKTKLFITNTIEQIRPELEAEKGAPLTHQEILKNAEQSEILKRTTSREQTLKREAIILRTRQNLAALAQGKGISAEFVNTLRQLSMEGTNLARQLESLKIPAEENIYSSKAEIVKKLLETGKSADEIIKAAEGVDFNNANEVTKFYRSFVKPKAGEIIDEFRYINMLSSPKTHIVNAFSNLIQGTTLAPVTKLATGTLDAIGSTLTGKPRQTYISEVPAYYKGFLNSIPDALKGAFQALKGASPLYRPDVQHISTGTKVLAPFQYIPRILEASDVFFRTLIKGGEMEALTLRAQKQGKNVANIVQQVEKNADYYIFRKALDPKNATGQGKLLSTIDDLTQGIYNLRHIPVVKWFIPFVQTPMNILKQGLEYSPAGITTLIGAKNKPEQLAKMMIGSTVLAGTGYLALSGNTTWAVPKNEKEKEAFYASGRQPYSVKIGDKWIAYSKLGPLAYPMAMAAAIQWYAKENPKAVTESTAQKLSNILSATAGFFADQSYVQGMGNLVDVLGGDITSSAKAIANLPSQLVPLASLQRWITQIIDPVYRKTETGLSLKSVIQNIIKGIPFASKTLPFYTTPAGEPSSRQYPLFSAFSPLPITKQEPKGENYLQDLRKMQQIQALSSQQKQAMKDQAQNIWMGLKQAKTADEAAPLLLQMKDNPDLRVQVRTIIKNSLQEKSYDIEAIKSLTIKERAQFITEKLQTLQSQEAVDFITNLKNNGIITDKVRQEMRVLLQPQ